MVKNKKSLLERARARMESRKVEGEQGSLILDILIGMAIFALIAIIAVSAISQYRERAYAQAVVSDAGAVGLALEAAYTDTQSYPATLTTAPAGVTLSKGVSIGDYDVAADGTFSVCLVHRSGDIATGTLDASVLYDSALGGIQGPALRGSAAQADCVV